MCIFCRERIDEKVARLHLEKIGCKLTRLSENQANCIGVKAEDSYKRRTTAISSAFFILFHAYWCRIADAGAGALRCSAVLRVSTLRKTDTLSAVP